MDKTTIYHITTSDAWAHAKVRGIYHAPSLTTDGFIHASTREQILPVANRFYRDVPDLIVLTVDATLLSVVLRWEAPAHPDGTQMTEAEETTLFPHIYGGIDLDAVIAIHRLNCDVDGNYELPTAMDERND